jgi:hypothetical protein
LGRAQDDRSRALANPASTPENRPAAIMSRTIHARGGALPDMQAARYASASFPPIMAPCSQVFGVGTDQKFRFLSRQPTNGISGFLRRSLATNCSERLLAATSIPNPHPNETRTTLRVSLHLRQPEQRLCRKRRLFLAQLLFKNYRIGTIDYSYQIGNIGLAPRRRAAPIQQQKSKGLSSR